MSMSSVQESAYLTEVHHVNGEGEDAGVVYCEMQGCENTGENRTHLAMVRAMYPGECGYRSETGGMLENLRTSTSHKKVGRIDQSWLSIFCQAVASQSAVLLAKGCH